MPSFSFGHHFTDQIARQCLTRIVFSFASQYAHDIDSITGIGDVSHTQTQLTDEDDISRNKLCRKVIGNVFVVFTATPGLRKEITRMTMNEETFSFTCDMYSYDGLLSIDSISASNCLFAAVKCGDVARGSDEKVLINAEIIVGYYL